MTDVVSGPRPVDTAPAAPAAEPRTAPPTPAPPNDAGAVPRPGGDRLWWLGLPASVIALFMVALDQSLTGVATTSIGNTLGASTIETQWVTTVNRVGQAVAIPAAAWLCKRYGVRPMYRTAMVLYIVLSVACAYAPTLDSLALCRFLEGIPGGLVAIVAIGALVTGVPMTKIAIAVPIMQAFSLCAPGFGPVIGGFLVLDVHWRAIFWVTAGMAVLGLVASLGLPRRPRPAPPDPFDLAGFVCLVGSVVAFTLGMSKGNDWGWTSYPVVVLFVVAVDLAALFLIIERQREHPLLDMAMFRNPTLVVGLVLTGMLGIELSAAVSFIPAFLKSAQGLSATVAGAVMVPQALALVAAVLVSNRVTPKWGLRPTIMIGLLVLGLGDVLLSRITLDMPRPLLSALLVIRAAGLGLAFVPILSGATSTLPMTLMPDAIQFRTIVQRIIGAVLVTRLTELGSHRQRQILDDQSGLLTPASQPALYAQGQSNPDSLLSVWNQLKFHGIAQSYSELFLIAGVLAIGGIVLVVLTRWGAPPAADDVVIRDGA